jgi:hypothetical protein
MLHEGCSGATPKGATGTGDQMVDVGQSGLHASRDSEQKVLHSEGKTEPNPEAVST